jgi:Ca-activated chloride channel homolog
VKAKAGVGAFLEQVGRNDHVGVAAFSDQIEPLLRVAPFEKNGERVGKAVESLIATGGTAFYDVTSWAFETVRALPRGNDRINAVVLLTDGDDTDSKKTLKEVLGELDQGDSENRVRVFTIAYAVEPKSEAARALTRIAATSGGKSYLGGTDDIESVYRSISSFF